VVDFYGRKIKSLPTSVTIGIKSVAETLSDAIAYDQMGFTILKVKTGLDVEEDIERVSKLFEYFNNRLQIRVDANQGYSSLQLKQFIRSTKQFNIELIEQPFVVGKENELLEIENRTTIAGDESIKDAHAAMQFGVGAKPFGIYNIKLMKCGGIIGAREIAQIAHHAQIDLFWGCNDESILSITAALHIAYASANTKYLDLDGSLDLIEDWVLGGFTLKDGHLIINDQPGFGVSKRSN
jgi:L-alanine-DL-glutamate epimerase-like enolase superfamily enzyme